MKLLKMLVTVMALMAVLSSCRSKLRCTPTEGRVLGMFPNKVWALRDNDYNRYCRFYDPFFYFDSNGTCVFSSRVKSMTGTYAIQPCNNAVEVHLGKDTFLLVVTAIKPHEMSALEVVAQPERKLGVNEWHFKEYVAPKKKEDK